MKEYTILSALSVILLIFADRVSGIGLLKKKEYYLFIMAMFGFKLLVNGYLTYTRTVIYNPLFFLGFRLGSIPLEDFFFGFSMVTCAVLLWEYFNLKLR